MSWRPDTRRAAAVLSLATLLAAVSSARGVTHLEPGSIAPPIVLQDLDGNEISLASQRGRAVLVIFGELYHQRTLQACAEVSAMLDDPRFADVSMTLLLVVAQDMSPEDLKQLSAAAGVTATVLLDVERRAFGAYRVVVMPSAVVIDTRGRVVHAVAGYTTRFADIVTDAMLVAAGKLSREQFEAALRPQADNGESEEAMRARRLVRLARQLVRRGLSELAEEKYAEALSIVPDFGPALLGRGAMYLDRGRLADAETAFRAVVSQDPASVEAVLGLAYVQTLRGGAELTEAEKSLRDVLAHNPAEPRAHYLLGRIHESRGQSEEASSRFRKASELLMSRGQTWDITPGSKLDDGQSTVSEQ